MNDYYGLNLFTKAAVVSFFVLAIVFIVVGTIFGEQGPGRVLFAEEELVVKASVGKAKNWSVLYEADLSINQPGSLAVSGDYLLVGDRGLKVIDLLDFNNEQQLTLSMSVNSISAKGKKVFLATSNPNQELRVVDFNRGLKPLLTGSFDIEGNQPAIKTLLTKGDNLVVAKDNGFFIFNVITPDRPVLVGQLITEDFKINDLSVSGDRLIAIMNDGRLRIIDISRVRAPRLAASLDLQCGELSSITVKGNRAYISCVGGELVVVNIKNSINPLVLSRIEIGRTVKKMVFVDNKRAFFLLEGDNNNVQLWNLDNALSLQLEKKVTVGGDPQAMTYNSKLGRLIVGNKVIRPE